MPRLRAALAVAAVMAAAVLVSAAPAPIRAGLACSLVVSSPSSPVPSDFAHVLTGEEVLFEGQFEPDVEVTITLTEDAVVVDEQVVTAEADGSLAFSITFEPTEIGAWAIDAEALYVPCGVQVQLVVEPAGPDVPVNVATFVCPDEIQSTAELVAAGEFTACDIAVRAPDLGSPPVGYSWNVVAADIDFDLYSADGLVRSIETANLEGGGTCDPSTLICGYSYAYQHQFVVSGEAILDLFGPAGYRLGHATVSTATEPTQVIDAAVDLEAGSLVFDVPEQDEVIVRAWWFADVAGPATPTPSASPPPLPDTTVDRPTGVPPVALIGMVLLWCSGMLLARRRLAHR
jgi:hypothetical protein